MVDTIQGHEAVGGASKRGRPDPAVILPEGVKAAAERSNALIAQAAAAKAGTPEADRQPIGETLKPPVARAPVAGMLTADFDPRNPTPPDPNDPRLFAPQPQQTPTPQNPAPPAPQQATPQNESDWEHQFKSLKGRYEREAEDKRRLQEQNIQQQRLLAQMNAAPTPTPQGDGSGVRFNVAPPPPGRRVTPQEVQEFGPELMDVVGRRAAEVYEPIIAQMANELNQVRRQIGGVQNTVAFDAQVQMYKELDAKLPNWNAINHSPQFLSWLDTIDPISHQPRRAFLTQAHNSNAAGQVLDIFNTFLRDYNAANGAANPQPTPGNGAGVTLQSNPTPTPPQFDLRQFVAPGKAKDGQTQVPPEKPTVYTSEIKQFYAEKTLGKWAGREAEAAAIERQIFEAGNENRIVRDR